MSILVPYFGDISPSFPINKQMKEIAFYLKLIPGIDTEDVAINIGDMHKIDVKAYINTMETWIDIYRKGETPALKRQAAAVLVDTVNMFMDVATAR